MMKQGIRNLMAYLNMVESDVRAEPVKTRLYGSGNTDAGLQASREGFLMNRVSILESVDKGQTLGELVDIYGERLETYHSPVAGLVGLIREFPVVQAGDSLYLIADEA